MIAAAAYAEAANLLTLFGTEVREVSSTGDVNAGRLIVHHLMEGTATAEIRIQRTLQGDSWLVAVEGESGNAKLSFPNGLVGAAVLSTNVQAGKTEQEYPTIDLAQEMVADFASAVRGDRHVVVWSDAVRAAELADWSWYSLERRRAVDIFHEERGELASFKGRMTSIGCGLIWITLLILIVIAAGKGLQLPGMDLLAMALAVVWVLFLLFQALRWALPAESANRGGTS
jgi:hypothetical protein